MVRIGGASINEYGSGEGGKKGDQNGEECYIQPWYLHHKGWVVIRAKSNEMREKIARDMEYLCNNDFIGYSFWEHCYGLYNESKKYGFDCSKVNTPCDTNCAKAVWVCSLYAGANVKDFSTADEVEKFRDSGEFEIITDDNICNTSDFLLRGDILVTKSKGHTVVSLDDGDSVKDYTWFAATAACGICVVNADAHLRKFPGTEHDSLKVIKEGEEIFCDGICCIRGDRIWYHTTVDNIEGFVSERMLVFAE